MSRTELQILQEQVADLVAREEIRNVLYSYCRAMDRGDRELLISLFHEDAIDHHGTYVGTIEGLWDTVDQSFTDGFPHGGGGRVVALVHSLGTILIDLRGDVAYTESYVTGVNICATAEGEEYYAVLNGRYSDRLERRDGGPWKIAARRVIKDLRDIRPVTSNPHEDYELGRRDRTDPGYPPS